MRRIVIGSVLGAILMFIWGYLFWELSPFPEMVLKAAPDQKAFGEALSAHLPESGTYVFPNVQESEGLEDLMASGPVATLHFHKGGARAMPLSMGMGFVHHFLCVFLLAVTLRVAARGLYFFPGRYVFLLLAGVAFSLFHNFLSPIFMNQPWDYHVLNAVYHIGAWAVAGIPVAWEVRAPKI